MEGVRRWIVVVWVGGRVIFGRRKMMMWEKGFVLGEGGME